MARLLLGSYVARELPNSVTTLTNLIIGVKNMKNGLIAVITVTMGFAFSVISEEALGDSISAYEDAVLADDPFLYYRFEEDSGATTAVDSAGGDDNGTYINTVGLGSTETGSPAGIGNSAFFGEGYVDVPDVGIHSAFTIEFWLNYDALSAGCCTSIFSTDTWIASSFHYNIKYGLDLEHALNGGGPNNVNSAADSVLANNWYHIVTTYDSSASGEVIFYLNGSAIGSGNHHNANAVNLTATGQIGAWNNARRLHGHIDEFAFYSSVLSESRVRAHYDAAFDVSEPGTLALLGLGFLGIGLSKRRKRS